MQEVPSTSDNEQHGGEGGGEPGGGVAQLLVEHGQGVAGAGGAGGGAGGLA